MTFVDDLEEGTFLKMTQLFHLNYNVDPEAGFGIESGATGIRCHHAPSRRSRTSPSCKSTSFVSVILVRRGSGRLLALSVLVTARRSRPVRRGSCATIVCESLPLFATMACPSAATRHRPTVVPSMPCR
jgi:hypothetical protein